MSLKKDTGKEREKIEKKKKQTEDDMRWFFDKTGFWCG